MEITSANAGVYPLPNANVPTWVYQNFGSTQNNVYGYWTMTPASDSSSSVWIAGGNALTYELVMSDMRGVRPVINLLKSAVE